MSCIFGARWKSLLTTQRALLLRFCIHTHIHILVVTASQGLGLKPGTFQLLDDHSAIWATADGPITYDTQINTNASSSSLTFKSAICNRVIVIVEPHASVSWLSKTNAVSFLSSDTYNLGCWMTHTHLYSVSILKSLDFNCDLGKQQAKSKSLYSLLCSSDRCWMVIVVWPGTFWWFCHEGVYLVCSNVWVNNLCQSNISSFLAGYCTEKRRSSFLTSYIRGFHAATSWCICIIVQLLRQFLSTMQTLRIISET